MSSEAAFVFFGVVLLVLILCGTFVALYYISNKYIQEARNQFTCTRVKYPFTNDDIAALVEFEEELQNFILYPPPSDDVRKACAEILMNKWLEVRSTVERGIS